MIDTVENGNSNKMSYDLSLIFTEYLKTAKKQFHETSQSKSQLNSNNSVSDFKTQSVKLLESVFSLRALLEALHEEYTSVTPYNDESGDKCMQMETNSNDMMKLCKECLRYINSSKFINSELPKDVRMHREAVAQMLSLYMKGCEDLSKENLRVKRMRRQYKKKHCKVDDSLDVISGSVNYSEADFSPQDLETLQINTDGVFRRLNADLAEKELIEKQIYEIGKMNQTLADNILEQHNLISNMEVTSGHSNLDIEYGNRKIQESMQNQSNMRFWIIFILLVLALSLMFIDWYRT